MDWIDPSLIERVGMALVHFLWQGILIGGLYAVINHLLRNARAQVRYDLGVLTLVVLALAPLATFFHLGATAAPATGTAAATAQLPALTSAPAGNGGTSVLMWVVGGWLGGVAILSLRLLIGWHYLSRLRRSADRAATRHLQPLLTGLNRHLRITRRVGIAASERISSPMVIGWIRPLILLPPALITGLPTRQIEMVLAHELAHIRRFDHWVNLFQTVVETLLFYHPVVIRISRRIRIEREKACDDLAVSVTADRLGYVEMLASLEKLRRPAPRLVLALDDGQILNRIRRLVERGSPGGQRGITLLSLAIVLSITALLGIGLLPDSAEDRTPIRQPVQLPAEPRSPPATATPAREQFPVPVAVIEPSRPAGDDGTGEVTHESAPRIADTVDQSGAPETSSQRSRDESAADEHRDQAGHVAAGSGGQGAAAGMEPETVEPPRRQLALTTIPETPRPDAGTENASPALEPEPPEISGGEVIRRVEPDYPPRARQQRTNGVVKVEFVVEPDGSVGPVEILEEQPRGAGFASAAAEAVAQWRFEPFRKGEQAISRPLRIEIGFDLDADGECRQPLGTRIPRC